MAVSLRASLCRAFAPPHYLVPPAAGIDISTSGVKAVRLARSVHGITLANYAQVLLPEGAFTDGEVVDRSTVAAHIAQVARAVHISAANVSLSESKSYLFETTVSGTEKKHWRTQIEQRLEELVPLPPAMTVFDLVDTGHTPTVLGVGYAHRIVDDTLALCDAAGVRVEACESENFSAARALLRPNDESTVVIVDIGKTTTKMCIVERCIPHVATTINIGGNALTLAVQKYFGVDDIEAKRAKAEQGIVPGPGNEEYLSSMLSTVSAIRDELANRLEYWQTKATPESMHKPVTRAILTGGNASLKGLPEYLEHTLRIPVTTGDVFTNFAPRDTWSPRIEYNESLAYATAIGLALYAEYE